MHQQTERMPPALRPLAARYRAAKARDGGRPPPRAVEKQASPLENRVKAGWAAGPVLGGVGVIPLPLKVA